MYLSDRIVRDYLAGKSIAGYREEWYFQQLSADGSIFTEPAYSPEERKKVEEVYHVLLETAGRFQPLNREVWDALFPTWPSALEHVRADLIIGFPQPYDAVAMSRDGVYHMVFDLICWTDYLGKADLKAIGRNLLTHELCHVMIGQTVNGIDDDLRSGTYADALDAMTFHEGFAHLVSYNGMELEETDWSAPKLREVRKASCEALKSALAAADEAAQADYLRRANCGGYYEKFACMAGMLYLAQLWRQGGTPALQKCFKAGYHGFAERCTVEE